MNPSSEGSTLPPLTPGQREHVEAASASIRTRIEAQRGWIPFDEFMQLALYAPGLGYYSAGSAKLGPAGDFITAPELSDLFSQCVARQAMQVLARTGGSILELGAGTGRMAAVVLQTLADAAALPERYEILEVSADLRERQQRRMQSLPAALRERVTWLERLPERPMAGVVLANEVLDALPCERFVFRGGEVVALGVGLRADRSFVELEACANETLAAEVRALGASLPGGFPAMYRSELCTRIAPWIAAVAERLDRGAMLLFDYGLPRAHYYHPQRDGGTLRCHFRQRAHDDPFVNVGVQDITAWVDFTRVAEAAAESGMQVSGFTTQAAFLMGSGIDALMAQATSTVARAKLASEARQLMMPGEMGEIFKAMALTRGCDAPLSGFAIQDLRRSL
jgi:SAM-dependent MidA family methyltransferase